MAHILKRYQNSRKLREARTKARVSAESLLPRLIIRRSNKYIYAQLLDVQKGTTLLGNKGRDAKELGKTIAELAKKKGIKKIVFDRGSYRYHGNVKMLAEAAREGGLEF